MPPITRYLCHLSASWWLSILLTYIIAHTPWTGENRDFPFVFLVVCLIANRAMLILWFLPQYWPFHPKSIGCHFPLVSIPSMVDKSSVNHALTKCCDPSFSPHTLIGASLGVGENSLGIGIIGKCSFAIHSDHERIQLGTSSTVNTFPSMAELVKDSAFEWIQFMIVWPQGGWQWLSIRLSRPHKMPRFVSQRKSILYKRKVFAIEANRQMLVGSFLLYEESRLVQYCSGLLAWRWAYRQSQKLLFIPVPIGNSCPFSNPVEVFIIICKYGMWFLWYAIIPIRSCIWVLSLDGGIKSVYHHLVHWNSRI